MRRASWLLLGCAGLFHLALLAGWRWPKPLVPYFFDATVLSGGRGLDFYATYQAGYNARHGWDIYEGDPAKVEIVVPYFTPFRYLPIVAYSAGAALSLLPPLTAFKLWVVLVELTFLACLAAIYRVTRHDPDLFARLAAMWLIFTPYYLELFMGQFSLVQGALIFGMLVLAVPAEADQAQTARWRLFGGLWLASLLWKINTVVFVPALGRWGRWRTLAAATAVVALTTLPYFYAFPAHAVDLWANNFGNTVSRPELGNLGFRQLVFTALNVAGAGPGLQAWAQRAVVLAVGGLALGLTAGRPAARPADLLSLWLTAYFLATPQVWEHHYVMMLPAVIAAYRVGPRWTLAALWLLLALPTPFGFTGLQPLIAANHDLRAFALEPAWRPLLQHASKALPTLALFIYWARRVYTSAPPGQLAPAP